MSYVSQIRKKWQYEKNVPRCATCVNFRKSAAFALWGSLPQVAKPQCILVPMNVGQNDLCRKWTNEAGDILE
jgi:hypothetical protein